MMKIDVTERIFAIKKESDLSWQAIADAAGMSVVWTTSTEVKLENGATIPAGSELTVHRYMPEGFVTLRLSVNVEGESTSKFETRLEDVSFLVIPYLVVQ